MSETPANQGYPRILDFLCYTYKTNDLVNLDPLAIGLRKADERARARTLVLPTFFEGSAAEFQAVVASGGRVKVSVAEMLNGDLSRIAPRANKFKDKIQGVLRGDYDIDACLVNSVTLHTPKSSLVFGVGIGSNVLPEAYKEIREKQVADLTKELGVKPSNIHIIAHIPPRSEDARQIPILKESVNAFHGSEVTRTFGGIVTEHLWAGLIALSPAQCIEMGLHPPPASHEPEDPPPGQAKAYNSWVIVPHGHVLSHVSNYPSAELNKFNYAVWQLRLPSGEPIPFLLMDLWTLHRYASDTKKNAMDKMDRRPLAGVEIELFPLGRDTWLNSCRPGEHYARGRVEFSVAITYTMFPRNFRTDTTLIPSLSSGFPRLSAEMRQQLGGGGGGSGGEGVAAAASMRENIAEQRLAAKQKVEPEQDDQDVVMKDAN